METRLAAWVETLDEGIAVKRDDIMCANTMQYFEDNKIDVPAVSALRCMLLRFRVFSCEGLVVSS
eukprot:SAG11_NODE_282_length_11247_cov_11.050323_9_plen_65_part_00